jgi:hypothetical protein
VPPQRLLPNVALWPRPAGEPYAQGKRHANNQVHGSLTCTQANAGRESSLGDSCKQMLVLVDQSCPAYGREPDGTNHISIRRGGKTMAHTPDQRSEYSPPRLQRLGTLVELTQLNSMGTAPDTGDVFKEGGNKQGLS